MRLYSLVAAILGVLLASSAPAAFAQMGAAGTFQTIQSDPTIHALGEATVARQGHPSQMGLNPATIGLADHVQFSSDLSDAFKAGFFGHFRSRWPVADELWIAAPSVDVQINRLAVGYQFKELYLGEHEIRNAQNLPVATVETSDRSHKLAAAYDVTDHFTAGAAINRYGLDRVGLVEDQKYEADGWSLDLGLVYRYPIATEWSQIDLSAGWSLTDFGRKVRVATGSADPISTTMRGGIGIEATTAAAWAGRSLATIGLYGAVSKLMVRWDCTTPVQCEADGPFQALFSSWQRVDRGTGGSSFETLSAYDQLIKHAGLELSVLETVSLRWGSFSEHPLNGGRDYDTIGFGIDLGYAALDHSRTTTKHSSLADARFWRLTARIPLDILDHISK